MIIILFFYDGFVFDKIIIVDVLERVFDGLFFILVLIMLLIILIFT
jgi:hypothetical protein